VTPAGGESVAARRDGGPARPGLRLIRRRSRALLKRTRGTRFAPVALVSAICAGAVVFGVLLEQVFLAQSAFKLSGVRRQAAAAEARHQELLLRVTKLQSPRRLERFARDRLGMVAPGGVEYIVADVGRPDAAVAVLHSAPGGREGAAQAASTARGSP